MPQQPTLVESMQIAHNAYQQKDFEDAAFHLAGALAQDPFNPDALSLFDHIIEEAPELDHLVPVKDNSFYGEMIARAYIESKQAHYKTAINLVIEVLSQIPDIGLERWLPAWLADARFRNISIDLEAINGFLSDQLAQTQGRMKLRPTEIEYYKRFTQTAFTLVKYFPEAIDVLVIASQLLRRANYVDDAIRLASDSLRRNADPDAAIALGLAYRASGQYNRAVNGFEQAYKLEKDPSFFIEMASTRWDAGGHKAALKYLKKALKKDESLENETEFNCMMRYLNNDESLIEVVGASAKPDDIKLLTTPLVGYLFTPKEYSLSLLAQSNNVNNLKGESVTLSSPSYEAPSTRLAIALATTGNMNLTELDYQFHELPQPDPRESVNSPKLRAWDFDDETGRLPIQACKRPRADVRNLVSKLADQTYYLPRWWAQAKQMMKNNPVDLAEFIGAMVYPEPTPMHFKTGLWVVHQQLASALLVAASDDALWFNSLRREILLDLLHGPIDWITDSVLIALTEIALDTPESVGEIAFEMEQLSKRIPEYGHWSLCAALPLCYKRLPGRSSTKINALNHLLTQYTETSQAFSSV